MRWICACIAHCHSIFNAPVCLAKVDGVEREKNAKGEESEFRCRNKVTVTPASHGIWSDFRTLLGLFVFAAPHQHGATATQCRPRSSHWRRTTKRRTVNSTKLKKTTSCNRGRRAYFQRATAPTRLFQTRAALTYRFAKSCASAQRAFLVFFLLLHPKHKRQFPLLFYFGAVGRRRTS